MQTLNGSHRMETKIIKIREGFNKLFENSKVIRGVTWSNSPELILELFKEQNLEKLELVVGEKGIDYREKLEGKVEVADELERLKEDDKLLIYTTNTTIHSKLYLVEKKSGEINFIITSANLTKSAQDAARQINYAHIYTLGVNDKLYFKFVDDYNQHKEYATLFLDDLTELIKSDEGEEDRIQIIEKWMKGIGIELNPKALRTIQYRISEKVFEENNEDCFIPLDEFSSRDKERVKNHVKKTYQLSSFKDNNLIIKRSDYIESLGRSNINIMQVDENGKKVKYASNSSIINRTILPGTPSAVDRGLSLFEDYLEMLVRSGKTDDSIALKANIYEALLYLFWSPFASQQMTIYKHHNAEDEKGLPFLYIHGPSNSGKSTFIHYVLYLITGKEVLLPDIAKIPPSRIGEVKDIGTCFPLVLDDINNQRFSRSKEYLSDYWKTWNVGDKYPTVVFITNEAKPKDWLKSRILRVDFDVHVPCSSPRNRSELNDIIKQDNLLFCWFSYLYLHDDLDKLESDLLAPVRICFKKLYKIANRSIPEYFPEEPIEGFHSIRARKWKNLIKQRKIHLKNKGKHLHAIFNNDIQSFEVEKYRSDLDKTIPTERVGNTIIIKDTTSFNKWVGKKRKKGRLWR